jgi:hypothetical protein
MERGTGSALATTHSRALFSPFLLFPFQTLAAAGLECKAIPSVAEGRAALLLAPTTS